MFTRQKTPCQPRDRSAFDSIRRGGYVLKAEEGALDAVLIATGSEVALAMAAQAELAPERGLSVRVVSMPSADVFLAQDADYQEAVLPRQARVRIAVEAGHPDYWRRFVGLDGDVLGIDRFGLSAPGDEAMAALGMTVENLVAIVARTVESAK